MDAIVEKDGKEISQTDHFKFSVFDEYVVIFLKEIVNEDGGNYKITIKNPSGSASASLTIYITGSSCKPLFSCY